MNNATKALIVILAIGWPSLAVPSVTPEKAPAADLAALLEQAVAGPASPPGAMLRVQLPALDFVWASAAGVSNRVSGAPLRPGQTLRIASNTKTFVAAAILRLVEEGRLDLSAPVAAHIAPASIMMLVGGGYDPYAITVRMLLQHTSGLFDYAASDVFLARVLAEPSHRWTRAEQLALAMDVGEPYGRPGEVYHYSDTGYILLGEMLDLATGSMARAVRELLDFDRLGLTNTWFETLEPRPPGAPPRLHQYQDAIDANDLDASIDLFGGGGLVSNMQDLAVFYRALVRGELFHRRETLETMLAASPQSLAAGTEGYGMGIGRSEHDGVLCFGHGGYWGTVVRHCPEPDLTLVAAVTDATAEAALRSLVDSGLERAFAAVGQG